MNKDLLLDRYGRYFEIPAELSRHGHHVKILCLDYNNLPQPGPAPCPMEWHCTRLGSSRFLGVVKYARLASKELTNADVVWACSDSFYGILACLITKLRHRPVVFDIYDNYDEFAFARLPLMRNLYHWAIRQSAAVTCLSDALKVDLRRRFPGQISVHTLPFGVSSATFHPRNATESRASIGLPPTDPIIGTAGALFKIRDIETILEAFRMIRAVQPDVKLALAGPRDIEIPADPSIFDFGILPYEQMPTFLSSLSVGIIGYRNDNFGAYCFPQKAHEMIACRIPIVAAATPGLSAIFRNVPRHLYEPGDARSLYEQVLAQLRTPSMDYPSAHTWERLTLILEDVFQSVVRSRRSAPLEK